MKEKSSATAAPLGPALVHRWHDRRQLSKTLTGISSSDVRVQEVYKPLYDGITDPALLKATDDLATEILLALADGKVPEEGTSAGWRRIICGWSLFTQIRFVNAVVCTLDWGDRKENRPMLDLARLAHRAIGECMVSALDVLAGYGLTK
jgi:hypothetical protein